MMDRAPQLDRVGEHPARRRSRRSPATNARHRSFSFTVGGYVTACGTSRGPRPRTPPGTRGRPAAAPSPGQSSPHSSTGSNGSARTCASVAAPTTNASAIRSPSPPLDERRSTRRAGRAASGPRRPTLRASNSRVRERDAVAVGPGRPPLALRVGGGPGLRGRRGARQVVGPGPHALAQLDHAQAGGRLRAAPTARAAVRAPASTTPSSHSPVHGAELGREAPVLRGLPAAADARPARRRRRPRVSSPRSTIRLSATRAVPSATPKSAHHSTRRPPAIRGGRIPRSRLPISDRGDSGRSSSSTPDAGSPLLRSCLICRRNVTWRS